MRVAAVLMLGVLACGPVEPPPPELWFETGGLPAPPNPCTTLQEESTGVAFDDGRLWIAMTATEHAEHGECIEEAEGPWSEGSDEAVRDRWPEVGLFASWSDDHGASFRALQRLSSGVESPQLGPILGVHAYREFFAAVVVVFEDDKRWVRVVWTEDSGESWEAPVDVGDFPEESSSYSTVLTFRGVQDELELVARTDAGLPFWSARKSDGFVLREIPTSVGLPYGPFVGTDRGAYAVELPPSDSGGFGLQVTRLTPNVGETVELPVDHLLGVDGLWPDERIATSDRGALVFNRTETECIAIDIPDLDDSLSFTSWTCPWDLYPFQPRGAGHDLGGYWTTRGLEIDDEVRGYELVWGWEHPGGPWTAATEFWHGNEDAQDAIQFGTAVDPEGTGAYIFDEGVVYRIDLSELPID